MRDHFTTPSKKRKRLDRRTLMLLEGPDASRVATRQIEAHDKMTRDMDLLMRLQFLEGVAGKQPGFFTGSLASGRGSKRAIEKTKAHFEGADPAWFSNDVFWFPKVLIYVKRTIGENDTGKLLSSAVGDLPASSIIGALLAGIYPWSLSPIMREPEGGEEGKMPSPPVYDGGRRSPFATAIENGELGPGEGEVLNRVKNSMKHKLIDQIRRYDRKKRRHTDEMMKGDEDQSISRFERAETQAEADAGDAFQTGLSLSPDLKDKLIRVIRKLNDSNPKKGDSAKFAAFLDVIRGMSPTEAAEELGALDDKGWPKRGVVPILMKQFGVSRGAITNAIPRAYAFVKETAARSTLAARVWDEIEDASEIAGLGYSRSKWARGKTGAHHYIGKDVYVDSDFVNASQHVWPTVGVGRVRLKHIGMGEFELVTPLGTIQFDRMRGVKFPGAVGRGHLMYDDSDGRAVKELLLNFERAGKSDRRAGDRTAIRKLLGGGQ